MRFEPRTSLRGGLDALVRALPGVAPAALVVGLLLCLLLPLSTVIIDLLLSLSLAGAVLVLVAGLRVRRAADFLGFPALVLLLTLFRLALNVSTTRLILTQADAGRVIDAFAELVVRGDLIVGAVMFAVITAIQYVVIARGAERVAEVAARFALDGMPGQQAAIDADLRAGAIGPREAQGRRAALVERSDFLGRMDGVMRWVKGDAVVGLLITGINLVGGVAVGSLRNHAELGESLGIYGKLAIGDGLLAQIPALLIALAAALLVARVDRVREHAVAGWLEPVMLVVPALLLGVLALVPGMPTLAFATTAAGLVAAALLLSARQPPPRRRGPPALELRLPALDLDRGLLARALEGLRRRGEQALGTAIPSFEVTIVTSVTIAAAGSEPTLELRLGQRVLAREQLPTPADLDAVILASFHALMRGADRLLEIDDIERAIEAQRQHDPSLVRQALRGLELVDVLAIARGFLRERVPLPSTEALLRALAEGRGFRDPSERPRWLEHAREALADHWLRDLVDGVAALGSPRWIRPSVDLEDHLIARNEPGAHGGRGALYSTPDERARLLARIGEREGGRPTIVLCSSRARPAFAALLAGSRPHVPVLALGELVAAGMETPKTVVLDVD